MPCACLGKVWYSRRVEFLHPLCRPPFGGGFQSVSKGANEFRASRCTKTRAGTHPTYPPSSAIATAWGERIHGTQTGMLHGIPWSARCVQRFDDSRNSAIHITYRVSLRSSSMGEPRDPLSKVVLFVCWPVTVQRFTRSYNHTSLV